MLLSVEEYERLKRRDRQVMSLSDFTQADLAAIKASKPSAEASQFDDELE